MGADFALVACRAPHWPDKSYASIGNPPVRAELERRIDELVRESAKARNDVFEDLAERLGLEECGSDREAAEQVRDVLLESLDALCEQRRDVERLRLDGSHWVFSGGMSWGDAPTEAFDQLALIGASRITEEPIQP